MMFTLYGQIQQGKITYEQYLECCQGDENRHTEWVNGEVVEMAPVSDQHADLAGFLHMILRGYCSARHLGAVRAEPFQMKTGPNLPGRSPDLLFIATENLSRLTQKYLDGPADLIVEVISPDSRARDRGEKFYEYEEGGVREYWLIDPIRRQAEFYTLGPDGAYRLALLEEGIYRSTTMPGLWLKVDWLWQQPLPELTAILREWKLI